MFVTIQYHTRDQKDPCVVLGTMDLASFEQKSCSFQLVDILYHHHLFFFLIIHIQFYLNLINIAWSLLDRLNPAYLPMSQSSNLELLSEAMLFLFCDSPKLFWLIAHLFLAVTGVYEWRATAALRHFPGVTPTPLTLQIHEKLLLNRRTQPYIMPFIYTGHGYEYHHLKETFRQ